MPRWSVTHTAIAKASWLAPLLCALWMNNVFGQTATAPAPASVATPAPPAPSRVAANPEKSSAAQRPAKAPAPVAAAAKPVEPAKPADAAKPVEPAKPAAAAKPAEPAKPAAATVANAADSGDAAAKKEDSAKKGNESKKPKVATRLCLIAEFRAIGMETGDGDLRRSKALKWLATNGRACSPQNLVALRNNRSQWMGAADSTTVAAAVDSLVEEITDSSPEAINLLYGTAPPPPKPTEDKKDSGKRN